MGVGAMSSLVSPASPEYAINVCLLSSLVLSSEALRIVAPRIAAFEAAMMAKSLPVMPRRTSLLKPLRTHSGNEKAKNHVHVRQRLLWAS